VWAGHVTINTLPDDVLLHIFLIDGQEYHDESQASIVVLEDYDRVKRLRWTWHRLVHVCRRWRSIVFASPNYLDLRLVCGPMTTIKLTGIWPPLPIIITNSFDLNFTTMPEDYDFDSAFVPPNRVREIRLFYLSRLLLQRLASQMQEQEQFPSLTHFILSFDDSHPASAFPDGFLAGSAPLLQDLVLDSIPFPSLPKLLLSATHLVRLILEGIPHSGYISPEAIVTALAGMANLGHLLIGFESPLSRPHRESRRPPPPTRTVFPALTIFLFKGVSEYLEDFVARIDASLLDFIYITFFHQLIFDIPQFAQFMRRTTKFQELTAAYVRFDENIVYVETHPPTVIAEERPGFKILCKELDWQLSSMAQVFTSFFPSVYLVEHLYIYELRNQPQYDIENMQWLEIFHPFTAVKELYLSEKSAPYIAPALQELVGGRTMEVSPTLQNIRLEGLEPSGPIPEGIQKFVAARQLSGNPIAVSIWERI
jgi:hypothetical protein